VGEEKVQDARTQEVLAKLWNGSSADESIDSLWIATANHTARYTTPPLHYSTLHGFFSLLPTYNPQAGW
jgi:hypothetical protein